MTGIAAKIKEIFSLFSWVSNKRHARKLFSPLAVLTEEEQSYWKPPGGFIWCVWDLDLAHSLQLFSMIPASRGHMLPLHLLLLLGMFTTPNLEAQLCTDLISVDGGTEVGSNLKLSHLGFSKLQGWYILLTSCIRGEAAYELWMSTVLGKIDLHRVR